MHRSLLIVLHHRYGERFCHLWDLQIPRKSERGSSLKHLSAGEPRRPTKLLYSHAASTPTAAASRKAIFEDGFECSCRFIQMQEQHLLQSYIAKNGSLSLAASLVISEGDPESSLLGYVCMLP